MIDEFLTVSLYQPNEFISRNLLDLVITDDQLINNIDALPPLGKSDHVVLMIETNIFNSESRVKQKFNYNKGDYDALRTYITCDWNTQFAAVDLEVVLLRFQNVSCRSVSVGFAEKTSVFGSV